MINVNNPTIRRTEIVEQQLKGELLVYDLRANKAYCLNETSALIYQLCDGRHSVSEITRELIKKLKQPVMEEFVWLALDQFKEDDLLSDSNQLEIKFNGLSRRAVIRKVGLASLIALPLISSLIAPASVMAQSCITSGNSCTPNNGTQSDCCDSGNRCTNNGGGAVCNACLTAGINTNCTFGAGCCTGQLGFFSNSCCNGVTETFISGNTFRCACN